MSALTPKSDAVLSPSGSQETGGNYDLARDRLRSTAIERTNIQMLNTPSLFPDRDTMQAIEDWLTKTLSQKKAERRDNPVSPAPQSQEWREQLQAYRFEKGENLLELMDWVMVSLDDGMVHMTHPGYMGLFNPAPTFPSECADRIASAYNPQICVWSHAPKAVEIEQHVIRQVARRAGLSNGASGHFTSGGAEANNTAVLCALTAKRRDFGEIGARAFDGNPIIYASRESHLAWLKIAHATGIGRESVRLVETDGAGRMKATALSDAIEADFDAGNTPVMIAATAGTTNAGMVDPLVASADLAEKHDTWFHVDAAWGGGLIACPNTAKALDGIQRADSITIDAHKWFATTMGAGMFLTSQPAVAADAFRVSASYMPDSEAESDFYLNSAQWSRRFLGLRLFLSLGAAGWDGYANRVEHARSLAERFVTQMIAHRWTKANVSEMAVVCLVPPEGNDAVESIVNRIQSNGKNWVSKAMFEGQPVLRMCVTNGRTTEHDIDELVATLVLHS
jgi:aromatic-L-amino-acid decarboxylase